MFVSTSCPRSVARRRAAVGATLLVFAMALPAAGAFAQTKMAVIDVERILGASERAKAVMSELQDYANTKKTELEGYQTEINAIRSQIQRGELSLSEGSLADLQRQYEDKTIALKRATDDAQREVEKMQQERLNNIEKALLPIINAVGKEGGYTMIFNRLQSGLVYIDETIDITNAVIARFDAAADQ